MQTKRENKQGRLVLLPPVEQFVPSDHRLRRLHRVLDLSFVHETVRDKYCQDNGRPSVDPEVVLRLFLLQAIEGIGQVRELLRQVQVNLAYRWFIGYELDEEIPDHSTLSKALDRFGDGIFNDLFVRSITQCQKSGLIEGKILHVDATTIRADINRQSVNQAKSSDPDARFGHFPGGDIKPGYKQQTAVDDRSRVIVGLDVVSADRLEGHSAVSVVDSATAHLGSAPAVVCADAGYGSGENREEFENRDIRLVSPPQKVQPSEGGKYFTVADFQYDESHDAFVCPAGSLLSNVGGVIGRPKQQRYAASRTACRSCALKERCTKSSRRQLKVSRYYGALDRLRADSRTESFKALYRRRAPVIEGIFAEAKQWHGLQRAWRRGLSKMRIQCLLIAAVLNFKRLVASLSPLFGFKETISTLINAIWSILGIARRIFRYVLNINEPNFV
ncbi:MAG: IS1182 family transposase [Candidatus Zixiibacteriota bacterium]